MAVRAQANAKMDHVDVEDVKCLPPGTRQTKGWTGEGSQLNSSCNVQTLSYVWPLTMDRHD